MASLRAFGWRVFARPVSQSHPDRRKIMNKKSLKIVLVSLAATSLFAFATPSFADISLADVNRFVKVYDTNKDGMVSKAELMKRAAEMFDKMDTGKKGMLDDKQAMAFLLELQKTDGNIGQMTSKADLMKKIETMFDKVDSGKKGMIDAKQAEAFLKSLMISGA
jgi:hypothetical protein